MKSKDVARIIIESHASASFAKGEKSYDKVGRLPEAKENAYILVDAQIKMLEEGNEIYLIKSTEGTDENYWKNIKEEIKIFKYD